MAETGETPATGSAGISVALSGGGHRAALFGLGVLMYLADAGKNRQVGSIVSVSGGSITNGFVGQSGNFREYDGPRFENKVAAPLARAMSETGTLFAPLRTKVYLIGVVLGFLASLAPLWSSSWSTGLRWLVTAVLLALWARILVGSRGIICALALRDTLYSPQGRATRLAGICTDVDHVFCATDLRAGEHVYFSGCFVYSYRIGLGTPGDLPLHDAVQASASFPGGFPPRVLPTGQFKFKRSPDIRQPPRVPRSLVLVDGGVYDNMAEEWAVGFPARSARIASVAPRLHPPEELLVVNAAAGEPWRPFPARWIPFASEVASLMRVISVLYDNTTTTRRQRLVESFDRTAKASTGMTGALIQITQSPFLVPTFFKQREQEWPERARRAEAALAALGQGTFEEWKTVTADSWKVPTILSALGAGRSTKLMHHAYVLAMCNLHVLLDYPLLEVPTRARFERLTASEAAPSSP